MLVIESIASDAQLRRLTERVARLTKGAVHASGLWGSSAPMVMAASAAISGRAYLYVTAHLEEADDARDDLELFLGRACALFPAWESMPGAGGGSGEIEAERLRICTDLLRSSPNGNRSTDGKGSIPHSAFDIRHSDVTARSRSRLVKADRPGRHIETSIIVAPIQALMQPMPAPSALQRNALRVSVGSKQKSEAAQSPDALLAWAVERGFERLDLVESPGDVARRGDIVDLFAPGEAHPYRIEFFDEDVESIRRFDVSTQRSIESLDSINVAAMPNRDWLKNEPTTDLFEYLPRDAVVVLDGPTEIHEMGQTLERRLGERSGLFDVAHVLQRCQSFAHVYLTHFAAASTREEETFDFEVASLSRFEGDAATVVSELCTVAQEREVHVVCDNDGERRRLAEMIAEQGSDHADRINLSVGIMHRGFEWTRSRSVVVPHHELFHRRRQRRQVRRVYAGRPLESWTDLAPNELVVHVSHGIAAYRGLHKLRKTESGQQEEFLKLEFAEGAVVHVPTSQVNLVQKYIGSAGHRPRLSKIGGKRWDKTKQQVVEAIGELAASLLRLQARRGEAVGTAYPADTEWQREFEAAFPYEETEDQLRVAEEIRGDLMRGRPMDRLVCGDVGYGKTELAMRAAFKVVEFGRQVAVLVPTTVLAEQHYASFRERLAEYPFSVACLSRFRSNKVQKEIIGQLKRGQIDVVIGTHRLLSKDVSLANLGLVIIDEEQRFGVESKERLKRMRETVDVLTLTATPIPRTLHMSLVGLRDISSLQTPPVDRRSIATQVRPFDRKLIRDAILREMNRDGQVFFVHNFVQSIGSMAATVGEIVPEARIVYGHGQMQDDELEAVMMKFVRREADVLVCTTIIESGIDIPSANTIFINRAERFGLADMHQLRGRVGRSDHRAYCYLLLSPDRPPTSKAAKRLKTIEEFSELGAGFRIAMRDLEIRGAGNLLGKEQSGHIAAVGYEMYCQLLEQTVRQLRNEPDPTPPPVSVDLDVSAHIPPHYVSAERARIELYRRVATASSAEELVQLEKDIVDAFGPFPKQVERLLELAEIRVRAGAFEIASINRHPPDVIFKVRSLPLVEPVFADAHGTVRMADDKTVHWRLPPAYLEPATLVTVLRTMLKRAGEREVVAS